MDESPNIIDGAIDDNENYFTHVVKQLKVSRKPMSLGCKDTAEIMMGRCELSQRSYKQLKKILFANNVKIPSYDALRNYCTSIDVGRITAIHHGTTDCKCMGYKSDLKETLQQIVSTEILFKCFTFLTVENQTKLADFLKSKEPNLYHNFNAEKRTIFIRDTGDNFRACGRYPTEQTSFSILNIPELSSCPYGQFISTLWRGGESRKMLELHAKEHYDDLKYLVENGVTLSVQDKDEYFNILVFFVADLSFVKEILGKCSCTQTYGCFHCELKIQDWSSLKKKLGQAQTVLKMKTRGEKAQNELGPYPDKTTSKYKKFIMNNFGQWVIIYFRKFDKKSRSS